MAERIPGTNNVFPMTHGETYTYTISREGYQSRSGTLTAGEDFDKDVTGSAAPPVILNPLDVFIHSGNITAEGKAEFDVLCDVEDGITVTAWCASYDGSATAAASGTGK